MKEPKDILDLNEITSYLLGTTQDSYLIHHFKTSEITFKTNENIPWTLDGEYGDNPNVITIKNLNKAVRIISK